MLKTPVGHAGLVHDLGDQMMASSGAISVGFSTMVQPAASAGRDLAGDLVDRPVPRRDQAAHADRLAHDQGACPRPLRTDRSPAPRSCARDGRCRGRPGCRGRTAAARPSRARWRRPHRSRRLLYSARMRAQQVQPLLARWCGAKAGKAAPGGGHGAVDVGRAADGDLGERLLGRRIDDVEQGGLHRIDPLAVDVETASRAAWNDPLGSADDPWQGPPDLRQSLYIYEYNVGKGIGSVISGKRT